MLIFIGYLIIKFIKNFQLYILYNSKSTYKKFIRFHELLNEIICYFFIILKKNKFRKLNYFFNSLQIIIDNNFLNNEFLSKFHHISS